MNYIFDLDHTVIDSSHRQLTRPDGSLDLDAWRANCTADKINADTLLPLARTMRLAYAKGHNVIICTARVLSRHDLTYLADNDLRYHVLLSRDEGDNTGDALLKRRALLSHFSGQPVARWARRSVFFDDNQGVLKMAKSLGIMTRDAIQLNQRMGA